MSELKNAPLVEAIFEIRWGQPKPGNFQFNQKEDGLLPGIVASLLSTIGYIVTEPVPNAIKIPHHATHRFRKKENTWPCTQIGLGVFTVNQTNNGYSWKTFKHNIVEAFNIFYQPSIINNIEYFEDAKLILKYQDAFYPKEHHKNIGELINDYFHLTATLPEKFYDNYTKSKNYDTLNMKFEFLLENIGVAAIVFASANINGKDGLIVETVVEMNMGELSSIDKFTSSELDEWLEKAHGFQKHVFNTVIHERAYNGDV